jgi:hypothetical protein
LFRIKKQNNSIVLDFAKGFSSFFPPDNFTEYSIFSGVFTKERSPYFYVAGGIPVAETKRV